MLEAFYDHVNKVFIVYTIHAALFDGALLKMDCAQGLVVLNTDDLEIVWRIVLKVFLSQYTSVLSSKQVSL